VIVMACRIARETGTENALRRCARYVGSVRWVKVPGALLRQRFVDQLAWAGLEDSVPPGWRELLRPEVVRVERRVADVATESQGRPSPEPTPPTPPPAMAQPDILPPDDFDRAMELRQRWREKRGEV
jgi:hypothetical protein